MSQPASVVIKNYKQRPYTLYNAQRNYLVTRWKTHASLLQSYSPINEALLHILTEIAGDEDFMSAVSGVRKQNIVTLKDSRLDLSPVRGKIRNGDFKRDQSYIVFLTKGASYLSGHWVAVRNGVIYNSYDRCQLDGTNGLCQTFALLAAMGHVFGVKRDPAKVDKMRVDEFIEYNVQAIEKLCVVISKAKKLPLDVGDSALSWTLSDTMEKKRADHAAKALVACKIGKVKKGSVYADAMFYKNLVKELRKRKGVLAQLLFVNDEFDLEL